MHIEGSAKLGAWLDVDEDCEHGLNLIVAEQDNCTITPVISKSSADFIEGLVKDCEEKGAKLLQKYRREGNLIWPLLIDHVTPVSALIRPLQTTPCWVPDLHTLQYMTALVRASPACKDAAIVTCWGSASGGGVDVAGCALQDMRLAWEEPFGPVVPVVRVKTVEEAVDHCNANNLALQGCVFSRDIDQGGRRMQAAIVSCNLAL